MPPKPETAGMSHHVGKQWYHYYDSMRRDIPGQEFVTNYWICDNRPYNRKYYNYYNLPHQSRLESCQNRKERVFEFCTGPGCMDKWAALDRVYLPEGQAAAHTIGVSQYANNPTR